jgi:hypothetical protein
VKHKNKLGSGLLVLIISTLILSYYINEYKTTIWQQKRLLNLEKIRLQSINEHNRALKQAMAYFISYKKLDNIPEYKNFTTSYGKISFKLIHNYNYLQDNLKNCNKYNIYRLDINSRIDLNKLDKYHEKIYLYVIVCEYEQDASSNGDGSSIRVLPISNIIS